MVSPQENVQVLTASYATTPPRPMTSARVVCGVKCSAQFSSMPRMSSLVPRAWSASSRWWRARCETCVSMVTPPRIPSPGPVRTESSAFSPAIITSESADVLALVVSTGVPRCSAASRQRAVSEPRSRRTSFFWSPPATKIPLAAPRAPSTAGWFTCVSSGSTTQTSAAPSP